MCSLFLEAESFRAPGGWVIDPSAMHEMGSAYLMAHGIGTPVADAVTEIEIAESAVYHIRARTRDWTAVWKRGTPAGRFTLRIDGFELPEILGTNGEKWAWQKAGSLHLSAGTHSVALHDLTGFNGRCDAIYFSTDPDDVPPDGGTALEQFRREKNGIAAVDDPGEYDLIVAGGGIAGTVTALAAARLGLRSLLLQDKSVLGGCNSSEVRVPLGGCTHIGAYPNIGNTVREIAPVYLMPGARPAEWYEDTRKINAFRNDCAGEAELRLNERVVSVETDPADPALITAVVTRSTVTGRETRYRADSSPTARATAFWPPRPERSTCMGPRDGTYSASRSRRTNHRMKSWDYPCSGPVHLRSGPSPFPISTGESNSARRTVTI